ncbi:uncharacterized protein TNCT_480751 [Trichonephila clavata]|uniref:Uncharacterized protein n=1 Tax=Trichonephila clavata TaxID=2740835 RepID=A0A8X6GM30_TRICU|nr:uncharacterized protein TNCT_480751 [Trichonephila clavata]
MERWLRRNLCASDIPLTLQEEVVAFMKPIELEITNWMIDHSEILLSAERFFLEFSWNSDGTINRIKTADSIINSDSFCDKTRFVLSCHYWSSWDVFTLFQSLGKSARKLLLFDYAKTNKDPYRQKTNVDLWIRMCREGSIDKSPSRWCNSLIWTDVSVQSRLLNHLSAKDREHLLGRTFENTGKIHTGRFCLSRMSASNREQLLTLYPLKVLMIYLFWPYQKFFLDSADRVWDQLSEKDFTCLLHIIICQKIVALWKDFDYVELLRQFWQKSPDRLKKHLEGSIFFKRLMNIINLGFPPKEPRYYLLHGKDVNINADECKKQNNSFFL